MSSDIKARVLLWAVIIFLICVAFSLGRSSCLFYNAKLRQEKLPDPGKSVSIISGYQAGDCFRLDENLIAHPIDCPSIAITSGKCSAAVTGSGNTITCKEE